MTTRPPTNPISCLLSDTDRDAQVVEWHDLGSLAISTSHIPNGVSSTYPLELADQLKSLATKENACCGDWLSATTTRLSDTIRLDVTSTSPAGRAAIEAVAGMSQATEGSR